MTKNKLSKLKKKKIQISFSKRFWEGEGKNYLLFPLPEGTHLFYAFEHEIFGKIPLIRPSIIDVKKKEGFVQCAKMWQNH